MPVSRSFRSALAQARGLGSAKTGTHHWWMLRVTAIALVPLTIWFVASLIRLDGANYEEFVAWLSTPVNAAIMIMFLLIAFYHSQLGLQMVIEDWVPNRALRTVGVIGTNLACLGFGILSVLSVIIIATRR